MTSSLGGYGGMRGATGSNGKRIGDKVPKGYGVSQLQNYTPEQMDLHNQQYAHVSPDSYLSRLASGDQSFFNEIEAPGMRQFNELQGGLASRFSQGGGGPGALGTRKSSGFQNATSQAASDFAQDLQSRRQQMQRQAISDLMGFSNQILGQSPYSRELYEKDQSNSGWGGLIGAGLGGLGGFALGGPAGAMGGAKLGYNVGSSF